MPTATQQGRSMLGRFAKTCAGGSVLALFSAAVLRAQEPGSAAPSPAGEANLKLPDLSQVNFLGVDGHTLLLWGILFCVFGLALRTHRFTRA